MFQKSDSNHLDNLKCILTVLLILANFKTAFSDEARAIIADSVSRSHQEVVPPELDHDAIDDGPIVSALYPNDHSNYLDSLSTSSGIDHDEPHRYPFIKMDFTYAKPVIIGLWILISSLAKFGRSVCHFIVLFGSDMPFSLSFKFMSITIL
ncbi:hypothetical protein JTE90_028529 [Oedothorax gibbosus]|uniref:Uncharacterized protein n=1 Tax=Oedothorax gibbosus TaxID=931172 RepID=A0AAV6VV15_9ARAC|nr:hypothetical protein JTE90_028529 [Oedothorax gibbosus]